MASRRSIRGHRHDEIAAANLMPPPSEFSEDERPNSCARNWRLDLYPHDHGEPPIGGLIIVS